MNNDQARNEITELERTIDCFIQALIEADNAVEHLHDLGQHVAKKENVTTQELADLQYKMAFAIGFLPNIRANMEELQFTLIEVARQKQYNFG